MSQAAKEVNIKAVVQALPTYVMGVFKLNIGFCEKYEKTIRDFCGEIKMISASSLHVLGLHDKT